MEEKTRRKSKTLFPYACQYSFEVFTFEGLLIQV